MRGKTYSTVDSYVVSHRSTNSAIKSLTMGERTGSRILFDLWPYDAYAMHTDQYYALLMGLCMACALACGKTYPSSKVKRVEIDLISLALNLYVQL
ncbi:hypothetical protein BJ508DRAFT_217985 [Ascobolus immersus RN42]|uniref:Uncharacterized protein n=1 Tax=Ascobolus immersus RN42 TaxID=1160509 RepID=A0A3N4HP81_ASCIM|nr:hypothetical protein BJ508DRAFT_217985 [Ascobolus immersus RN42]